MKCPGLSPVFLAATLFIAPAEPGRAAEAPTPAPAMSVRAADLLKRFDKNGDGKLDEAELADAREAMLQEQISRQIGAKDSPRTPQLPAKMLEMFDKNHDGRLDNEERAAMRRHFEENGLGSDGEIRRELLLRFDQDQDGKLNDTERAEMMRFLSALRVQRAAQVRDYFLREFDRNGDGKLDENEWAAAKEQVLRVVNARAPVQLEDALASTQEEQARLERVAAEVARRRELREKALKAIGKP